MKLLQAKNISDTRMFEALAAVRGKNGAPKWSSLYDVLEQVPEYPPKVVLAKLRGMVKRKILEGCACGCRGDFELPPPKAA
jgi:hypothetical protein